MARMPKGEPRSVPDPVGEQYDAMIRQERLSKLGFKSTPTTPRLVIDKDYFSPFADPVARLDLKPRHGQAFKIGEKTYREIDNGRANILVEVNDTLASPAELAERRRGIDRAFFIANNPIGGVGYGLATLANRSPGKRDAALMAGGLADAAMLGAAPRGATPRIRAAPPPRAQPVSPPLLQDNIRYRDLSANGQAMGARATLTPGMLSKGSKVRKNPPGWQGNGNFYKEHRAHLIGKLFGGMGQDRRNAVTMTDRANSLEMRTFEERVKGRVKAGEVIEYSVTPLYNEGVLPPASVLLTATGSRGAPIARLVNNPAGRRK